MFKKLNLNYYQLSSTDWTKIEISTSEIRRKKVGRGFTFICSNVIIGNNPIRFIYSQMTMRIIKPKEALAQKINITCVLDFGFEDIIFCAYFVPSDTKQTGCQFKLVKRSPIEVKRRPFVLLIAKPKRSLTASDSWNAEKEMQN